MHKTGDILQERYLIERALGQGGMGGVYLATHRALDVQVAIKEMTLEIANADDRIAAIGQFRKEAQILHLLHHDNLPRVHDFFDQDGKYYLAMDYIQGRSLQELIAQQPLSEEELHRYNRPLCAVLDYLHTYNPPIIFRDLKPSNIMLGDDGVIKLIDFGIAKDFDTRTGRGTRTSARGAGTPGFAAPEQYGAGSDVRTDIYALGATLYTLLTRQIPPDSVDIASGGAELQPLLDLRPHLSPTTARVIEWMLCINRTERPASIKDVAIALGYSQQAPYTVLPQRVLDQIEEDNDRYNPNATRNLSSSPRNPHTGSALQTAPPPAVEVPVESVPSPETVPPLRAPATSMAPPPPRRKSRAVPVALCLVVLCALAFAAWHVMTPRVTVHLVSVPPGASVVVNHSPGPTTPCDLADVPTNAPMHVELTLHGYQDLTRDIAVQASPAVLKLVPATTFVVVSGTPTATVKVDGVDREQVGSEPSNITVEPGLRHLRIHADGYAPNEQVVTVRPGQEAPTVMYTLQPDRVSLEILGPDGAEVTFNDKRVGTIRDAKPLLVKDLEPKNYPLSVTAPGYQTLVTGVPVLAGTQNRFDCSSQMHRLAVAAPAAAVPTPAPTEAPAQAQPSPQSTEAPVVAATENGWQHHIQAGVGIDSIAVGSEAALIISGMRDEHDDKHPSRFGNDTGVHVSVNNGRIASVGIVLPDSRSAITTEGIHGGSTVEEVVAAYGPAEYIMGREREVLRYDSRGIQFGLAPRTHTVGFIMVYPPRTHP